MRTRRYLLLLLALCLAGGGQADAQMADAPLTIPELTIRSEIVLVGDVVRVQSEWNDTRTAIVTRVDLRVDELLKGSIDGGLLSIHQLGGQIGAVTSAVGGTPLFTAGERVLLFLSTRRTGELGVTGLFQGKFSVENDSSTGQELAMRRVPGLTETLDRLPLNQARDLVRRALGG